MCSFIEQLDKSYIEFSGQTTYILYFIRKRKS